ncbi:hypothetical protein BB559_004372 [Furculomyces boomerangus]|uniref:Uncharacterized protein n=2 Tax=Harpellales TaxID=61421 RepID=A0A2T9YF40_9FUNG|nr:hypothetical protein BB559_004372 [Furculomyces boomerangus]PWA02005.1 hypothetical protein BB558_001864 [Smittium angustum]
MDFGGWLGKFDIVVANPPYIPSVEYETLDNSVRNWEDKNALVPVPLKKRLVETSKDNFGINYEKDISGNLETNPKNGLEMLYYIVELCSPNLRSRISKQDERNSFDKAESINNGKKLPRLVMEVGYSTYNPNNMEIQNTSDSYNQAKMLCEFIMSKNNNFGYKSVDIWFDTNKIPRVVLAF